MDGSDEEPWDVLLSVLALDELVEPDAGEMAFKESRQSTAEVMFLSAIKEAESEGVQDPWLGKINYELGDLYSSLGRLKEAEPAYNRAIAIFEKLKEPSNVAVVVKNLLSNYTAQDKYPEAEKCVKEGLEFVEQSKKAGDETIGDIPSRRIVYGTSCTEPN